MDLKAAQLFSQDHVNQCVPSFRFAFCLMEVGGMLRAQLSSSCGLRNEILRQHSMHYLDLVLLRWYIKCNQSESNIHRTWLLKKSIQDGNIKTFLRMWNAPGSFELWFALFQELQNSTASEGQVVVLECRVRGPPPIHVKWFRQGIEIQDSPDFRILQKSKAVTKVF